MTVDELIAALSAVEDKSTLVVVDDYENGPPPHYLVPARDQLGLPFRVYVSGDEYTVIRIGRSEWPYDEIEREWLLINWDDTGLYEIERNDGVTHLTDEEAVALCRSEAEAGDSDAKYAVWCHDRDAAAIAAERASRDAEAVAAARESRREKEQDDDS